MPRITMLMTLAGWLAVAATAAAQRPWVEATGPNVTVVTDAGAGRARDLAWQFEQVREAMARVFPWVRLRMSRPLMVLAARNEATMRLLTPGDFEGRSRIYSSVSVGGADRYFIALRSDFTTEDREGVNPYESAYWSFAATAFGETSHALPTWLQRGMASVVSNTLVRKDEIQLGRILEQHVATLRSRPRMSLNEVVSLVDDGDSRLRNGDFLAAHSAHAWALVHFLVWANEGAFQEGLDRYIKGVLRGADPVKSLASTLGDVSRLEAAFNVYINRDIFPFTKFLTSAKLRREAFPVRDVAPVEMALLRAAHHVAHGRPADAKASLAEAQQLQPGVGDEVAALIADREGRNDDARAALGRAVDQPFATWWAPYRLATLESPMGQSGFRRIRDLLTTATGRNPNADWAWAYLGVAQAELDERETAVRAVEQAIELAPASSANRRLAARTYLRLDMPTEARTAAGLARALATTPEERGEAQDMLAAIARRLTAAAPEEPANTPDAGAAAPAPAADATQPDDLEPAPVARRGAKGAEPPRESSGSARPLGVVINDCFIDPVTCKAAVPVVERECRDTASASGGPACRAVGYILDAGLGMTAQPMRAAELYTLGCDRRDEISCVRLATLRSLGRGVARDPEVALAVLEPSCERGTQEACYRFGLHLSATGIAADRTRAREVFAASCKAEFAESCAALKKLPQ
jgi:tetratricopeptide (TPR) repeat protein